MIGADLGGAAALVLAVVFAWAGAAKLVAPSATAASFSQLGLPWPRAAARVVPVVELGLSGALVAGMAGAALVAVGLLAVFTVVLARAVTSREPVSCACFGAAANAPVTRLDLVRNGMLALLALAAIGGSGDWPSFPALIVVTSLTAVGRVGLAVAALAALVPLWPGEPQR